MLKVGIVGVGGISGAHIPAWEEMKEAELVAMCDVRPERMEAFPEKHRYTDFDEMLEKEELDILDICLPTYLHADYAVKALEKGINVLCEKPISLDRANVDCVYGAAKKNGVRFMIAHVLRFWPEFCRLKEIYDTKEYGKLLSGTMTRLGGIPKWSWNDWMRDEKLSGLVPFDLHIHDLDFLVYMLGAPKSYQLHRAKLPTQDYMSVTYEYDGFFINTQASWFDCSYPFTAEFAFQFEKAVVAFEHGKLQIYEQDGTVIDTAAEAASASGTINLPTTDAYANEIRYFADCVLAGKDCDRVKPEELKAVLDILCAMLG